MAAYHELVEEKIIPALQTEVEGNLSKENIQTILTSLEQTIEELNQKMADEHVVRFVKISDLKEKHQNYSIIILHLIKNVCLRMRSTIKF